MNLYVCLDSSFQNSYYAVDGITAGKVIKYGFKAALSALSIALSIGTYLG